jgi:hypothetical protein
LKIVVLQASLDVGIALILIQGSLPSSWSPLNNGAPATQLPSFKFHDFQQPSISGCPDFPTLRLVVSANLNDMLGKDCGFLKIVAEILQLS